MDTDQVFTLSMTLLVGGLTILGAVVGSLIGVFIEPYFRYVEEIENFEKYIFNPFISASAEAQDYIKVYFGTTEDTQLRNRNRVGLSLDRLREKTLILHNSGLFIQLIDRGENSAFFGSIARLEIALREHQDFERSTLEEYNDYLRRIMRALNKCEKSQEGFDFNPICFCAFFHRRLRIFCGRKNLR